MVLKPCRECNKEISTEAKACPHCGHQDPHGKIVSVQKGCLGCLGLIVIFIVIIVSRGGDEETEEIENVLRDYRATNAGGGAACFTEDAFDEYMDAVIRAKTTGDTSWMASLYSRGDCIRMPRGARVTVNDYGFLGASQIYLHPKGGGPPVLVWTANENFSE